MTEGASPKRDRLQGLRYLIAGGWNTAFGYSVFALLYHLLHAHIHYIIVSLMSNVIAITAAYISYKFFVFKTKGNYLREYLRFYVVYGAAFAMSLVVLPFFVEMVHLSPYLAQGVTICLTVVISFFGHRGFSFKT